MSFRLAEKSWLSHVHDPLIQTYSLIQSTNKSSLVMSRTWASCCHRDNCEWPGPASGESSGVTNREAAWTSAGGRGSGQDGAVERGDPGLGRRRGRDLGPSSEGLGLLDHKRRVHAEERLLRHGRPAVGARPTGRGWRSRSAEDRGEALAVHHAVDGPARRSWGRWPRPPGGPPSSESSRPDDEQQRVAHRFQVEPSPRKPPEQPVLGVNLAARRAGRSSTADRCWKA